MAIPTTLDTALAPRVASNTIPTHRPAAHMVRHTSSPHQHLAYPSQHRHHPAEAATTPPPTTHTQLRREDTVASLEAPLSLMARAHRQVPRAAMLPILDTGSNELVS